MSALATPVTVAVVRCRAADLSRALDAALPYDGDATLGDVLALITVRASGCRGGVS